MSASEDAVAPFAVGPVGSADDWEALQARIHAFDGVSWQRRKDINNDDCERTWRALLGNSTPNDFAQSSIAFSGVWSASIYKQPGSLRPLSCRPRKRTHANHKTLGLLE